MNNRILFVDDEANILQAYKRQLRKHFDLHTAEGPEAGLKYIQEQAAFAVVVSDFSMPGMNGVEFLTTVKQRSPDTVRIMLTGYANADNAIDAVNEGNIFRFLGKPCPTEQLVLALEAALKQYHLIIAEKELLEKTLFGSIKVMSQILGMVNPLAFSSTSRVKSYVKHMVTDLGLPGRWRYELAAMLCQLGYITLPPETTLKVLSNQPLSENETMLFNAYPSVAASLLENIPRLGTVSQMVNRQQLDYSDCQLTDDSLPDDPAILGGLMLRVALDFDLLIGRNKSLSAAIGDMKRQSGIYHPQLLKSMLSMEQIDRSMEVRSIYVKDVTAQMIADEDIHASSGLLLVAKGQEISTPNLKRLRSFAQSIGIIEPFRMRIP